MNVKNEVAEAEMKAIVVEADIFRGKAERDETER